MSTAFDVNAPLFFFLLLLPPGPVEPAPGVDFEGLEVARECLEDVFKLGSSAVDDQTKPDSLVDIFTSLGADKPQENKADRDRGSISADVPSSSLPRNASDSKAPLVLP